MIKVKYNGKNEIMFSTTTFAGDVKNGDIIDVEKEVFKRKLKHLKKNGNFIWVEHKETVKKETKKENTEIK